MVYALINEDPHKSKEVEKFDEYITKECGDIFRRYALRKEIDFDQVKTLKEMIKTISSTIRNDIQSTRGDLNWSDEMEGDLVLKLDEVELKRSAEPLIEFLR